MTYYADKELEICNSFDSEKHKQNFNSEYNKMPEIISFTDFLRWNCTEEYGRFIRKSFTDGTLELPVYINPSRINDVYIISGKYSTVSELSFLMYVICQVTFIVNGKENRYKYCVYGLHDFFGNCDYFLDAALMENEYIRIKNPMDEFLVPILSKKEFDNTAFEFLSKYYPEGLEEPCKINALKIAERMGFNVVLTDLSMNKSIHGKIIFHKKAVTVYENGQKIEKLFPANTILIQKDTENQVRKSILHECIHAYLHRRFYELQALCHTAVGMEAPLFFDFYNPEIENESIKWMEAQADSIPPHIIMYFENVQTVIDEYKDFSGKGVNDDDFSNYGGLINKIADVFGTSIYAARKRLIELGYWQARGVLVYGDDTYSQDHYIPQDFPSDYTYTLPLLEMSKLLGRNLTFDKCVFSGKFIYADGHLCINLPEYVYEKNGRWYLTDYARQNMSECCLPFKRVYGHKKYNYTFGEMDSDGRLAIDYVFDDKQFEMLEKKRKELLLNQLYVEENGVQRPMTRGETAVYHMKRLKISVENLQELTGMSKESICSLRGSKPYFPRPETVYAFCVGLKLEKVYFEDMLDKTNAREKLSEDDRNLYTMILETVPNATVHQINDYLVRIGKTAWTRENKRRKTV